MGKVWSVYTSSDTLLVVGSRGRRVVSKPGPRMKSQTETNAVALLRSADQTGLGLEARAR